MKLAALLLVLASFCFARTVTVDLDQLPQNIAQKVEALAIPVDSSGLSLANLAKYTEMGKGIGIAVAELCKALNVGVNEFAKTRVGTITMGILVWKLIGRDIWGIFGGSLFFIIFMALWWKSYSYFHISERILRTGADGQKERVYVPKHVYKGDNEIAVGFCHVIALLLIVITALCLIF